MKITDKTISEVMAAMGRKGGKTKHTKPKGLAALTFEERQAISAKGLAKRRQKKIENSD